MNTHLGNPDLFLLGSPDPSRLLHPRSSLALKHLLPLNLLRRLSEKTITVSRTLIGEVDIVWQGFDFIVCKRAESAACQSSSRSLVRSWRQGLHRGPEQQKRARVQ